MVDLVDAVEFERWCEASGLSAITRTLLKSEGFASLDSMRALSDSDIDVLNLEPLQKNALELAIQGFNTKNTPIDLNQNMAMASSSTQEVLEPQTSSTEFYPNLEGYDNEFSDPQGVEPVSHQMEDVHIYSQPQSSAGDSESSNPISIPKRKSSKPDGYDPVSPTSPQSKSFKDRFKTKDKTPSAATPKEKKGPKKTNKILKFYERVRRSSKDPTEEVPEVPAMTADRDSDLDTSGEQDTIDPQPCSGLTVDTDPDRVSTIEEEPPSPPPKSMKERYLECSELVEEGAPSIYELPYDVVSRDVNTYIRKCDILVPDLPTDIVSEEKVILCVGATGAGKTVLINGLVNHLLDVQWEDGFRFKVVPDPDDVALKETSSQTMWITVYNIYAFQGQQSSLCKYTIIDTPGFGDTEGITQDQKVDEKILNLFQQSDSGRIDVLHAVCFVTHACEGRLNALQKYIYHRVMSVFGKDVEDNIFIMVTHADSSIPLVINTLQEADIPFTKYFKFNNAALYQHNEGDDTRFDSLFWEMGMSSYESFFGYLRQSVEPVSLGLTKDVLAKREALQVYIAGLQENVKKGLLTLDELRQEMQVVRQHETDIALNRNFTYKVKEHYMEMVEKPPGQHVTNCSTCSRTCHQNCKFPQDQQKRKCSAMDSNGYCRVCTPPNGGKCSWADHYNMSYYFIYREKMVEKRSEDLYDKYRIATNLKIDAETLMQDIMDKFNVIQSQVLWQTNEIRKCLKVLGEIALKPSPLTTVDYIDQMIMAESEYCESGWRERVQQLHQARKQAEYLQKLADDGYDPWEEGTVHDFKQDDEDQEAEECQEPRSFSIKQLLNTLKGGLWADQGRSRAATIAGEE